MTKNFHYQLNLLLILIFCLLSGCATLDGPENPDDPFERFNRSVYSFNEKFDEYAFKPVAKGYKAITPDFIDTGITNFFRNLDDVTVIINDLLQFKVNQSAQDIARLLINSTLGLLGFIDVATTIDLPKHDEDFGQTLGVWGIDSGPYLVLPFIGPSSIRDGVGFAVDTTQFNVITETLDGTDEWLAIGVKYTDIRGDLLKASKLLDDIAPDPYAFIRDAWVQRRNNLLHDGSPPESAEDENLFEDDLFTDDIIRK